jgi:ubiquinone/menaquinone biosynthesis C-methylase UbiE
VSLYREQIVPRVTNVLLANGEFAKIRKRVVSTLSGEVLEVGFGSGLNVPYYPPEVRRVLAVDPARVGWKLAGKRLAASPVPVEYVDLDCERLTLADEVVDHVLVTWTLCTIPDVARALIEMRRVLRPTGQLHFIEHGRSPDPSVAGWQDRLNPIQRWWAGGCNLNRPIDRLVEAAGFEIANLDTFYAAGPRPMAHMYEGIAVKG